MPRRPKKVRSVLPALFFLLLLFIIPLLVFFLPRVTSELRSRAAQEGDRTEFPVAVYIRGFDIPYQELKDTGVNVFHIGGIYDFDGQYNEIVRVLDGAEDHELKVILDVNVPMQHPVLFPRFEMFLDKIKSHPALYGYYLMDEPELYDYVNAENFRLLNSTIKKHDTEHPTIVVFSSDLSNARKYFGVADIAGFNIYSFIRDTPGEERMTADYKWALDEFLQWHAELEQNSTRAYFMIPQAFSDEHRREPGAEEQEALIEYTRGKSALMQGLMFYQWTPDGGSATALGNSANLRSMVKSVAQEYKGRFSQYPVRFEAQQQVVVESLPSPVPSPVPTPDTSNTSVQPAPVVSPSEPSPAKSAVVPADTPTKPRSPAPLSAEDVPSREAILNEDSPWEEFVVTQQVEPSPVPTDSGEVLLLTETVTPQRSPWRSIVEKLQDWIKNLF